MSTKINKIWYLKANIIQKIKLQVKNKNAS